MDKFKPTSSDPQTGPEFSSQEFKKEKDTKGTGTGATIADAEDEKEGGKQNDEEGVQKSGSLFAAQESKVMK